jgi:hypothetical protein
MRCIKGEKSIGRKNGKTMEITIYAEYYSFTLGEIPIINAFVYIVPGFPCLVNLSTYEKESHA